MKNLSSSTLAAKRDKIKASHSKLKSWTKLAQQYPGVKRGTLQRFATSNYVPKSVAIRRALGLHRRERPDYDTWRERNMRRLAKIVEWATGRVIESEGR